MINEKQTIRMLENEIPQREALRLERMHLYQFMQSYSSQTSQLGESGDLREFEIQLIVADRIYGEGTAEVKEAMELVYIPTLSHSLERKPELLSLAKKNLSGQLLKVMYCAQRASNP